MEFCHPVDCGEFAVTPMLVAPVCAPKCCEEAPMCYPCLPRCSKPVYYCCERKVSKTPPRTPAHDDDCCHHHHSARCYPAPPPAKCYHPPPPARCDPRSPPHTHHDSCKAPAPYCETCCHPTSKPVKTKYIIPCYRYEDGRIERYVPTRYGRLPMSAYRRNGMQDQIHGYRGAIRYLCTGEGPSGEYCVHTAIEPMSRIYPRVTQEMLPVRKLPVSAFKRNGMQDQEHSKMLGTANFLMRCPRDVSIECDVCTNPVKVADPAKVPSCCPKHALGCGYLKKKPIETNQPTVLMRRACEVACGTRARRKPFIVSSYAADPYNEVRRYHSEDERGNCCYHFERVKPVKHCCNPCAPPSQPCVTSPGCQYVDCVYARPVDSPNCCYYSR